MAVSDRFGGSNVCPKRNEVFFKTYPSSLYHASYLALARSISAAIMRQIAISSGIWAVELNTAHYLE